MRRLCPLSESPAGHGAQPSGGEVQPSGYARSVTFRSTVELGGKTATGLRLPAEAVAALGTTKKPKVVVTVGRHSYRSTVALYGGEYFVPLNRQNREAAGVAAGDEVEVSLALDTEPRVVDVPHDLATALNSHSHAREGFAELSYSRQREYVDWVTGAKRPDTRQRRIAEAVRRVADGKPRQ